MISVIGRFLNFTGVFAATVGIFKLLFASSIVVFAIFAAFVVFAGSAVLQPDAQLFK